MDSIEAAFWRLLESEPDRRIDTMLVFADWMADQGDKRETGMRVLAALERFPHYGWPGGFRISRPQRDEWSWWGASVFGGLASLTGPDNGPHLLPHRWRITLGQPDGYGHWEPTLNAAISRACMAFLELDGKVQREIYEMANARV